MAAAPAGTGDNASLRQGAQSAAPYCYHLTSGFTTNRRDRWIIYMPGLRTLDTLPAITARGRAYHVHAEQTARAPACCGTVTRNGRRTVRLTDTPAHGGP